VLEGSLPTAKMRLVLAWIEIHREELVADWALAAKGEQGFKIEPLWGPRYLSGHTVRGRRAGQRHRVRHGAREAGGVWKEARSEKKLTAWRRSSLTTMKLGV